MARSLSLAVVITVLTVAFSVASGGATTVVVISPGAGTLQAAIDAASGPTTIKMMPGIYTGAVSVTKPNLNLLAKGGPVVIDGNCGAAVALDIAADNVRVKGAGRHGGCFVRGGTTTQVRIANHSMVQLKTVDPDPQALLPGLECGTEQNGLEISGSSSKVTVTFGGSNNSPGAGILLSGIAAEAFVTVRKYGSQRNGIGLVIENSGKGAPLGKSGIVVKGHFFEENNTAEISIVNSDGVLILGDGLQTLHSDTGVDGIHLDATSNANLIVNNMWIDLNPGNGNSAYVDAGTGNCGTGNNFAVPICP
jgi:hypothetical protein